MKNTILFTIILFIISAGTAWACIPEVTPTINVTIEPSQEPTVEVSVAPSEPVVSLEPVVTATPSAQVENKGDGKGDGLSDGLSSCPSCTQAPVVPNAPPATGRAL